MDPEEFEAFLASLPPEEREAALYELGFGEANQLPYSFGSPMSPGAPQLSPGAYDLSMMQQQPPDIEYGDVQPFGLDEFAQMQNAMQDTGALTLDPAIAAYAGPGAFTAGAFEPTTIPLGDPLDLAGGRYVSMLANSGPGYESYLAQKIQSGMNPGQAVAQMWADISQPAPGNEQLAEALKASLPPVAYDPSDPTSQLPSMQQSVGDFTTPQGQASSANVDAITEKATELFDRMASDPVPGYVDPNTGMQFAGSYQQPSELAQKFADYGIPTPNESYLDDKWLNAPITPEVAQERAAREQFGLEGVQTAVSAENIAKANMDAMTKAWDEAQKATGPQQIGTDPNNPYALSSDALGSAQSAADLDFSALKESGAGPSLASFRDQERAKVGLPPISRSAGYSMAGLGDQTDAERELQTKTASTARDAYGEAYADWEEENRKRLEGEAQKRGANATQSTQPFALSSNGEVFDTYTFGGSPEQQQAMGQLANVWGRMQGLSNPQVSTFGDPRQTYQSGVDAAGQQFRDSYFNQIKLHEQTDPSEIARASAAGQAYGMMQNGRNPMQDVLMQRAMGRRAMYPMNYGG